MNTPVNHESGHPPFSGLMVAGEGGSGLLPLARYAMRFATQDAALRLVSVACNPRLLFPLLTLDYARLVRCTRCAGLLVREQSSTA